MGTPLAAGAHGSPAVSMMQGGRSLAFDGLWVARADWDPAGTTVSPSPITGVEQNYAQIQVQVVSNAANDEDMAIFVVRLANVNQGGVHSIVLATNQSMFEIAVIVDSLQLAKPGDELEFTIRMELHQPAPLPIGSVVTLGILVFGNSIVS